MYLHLLAILFLNQTVTIVQLSNVCDEFLSWRLKVFRGVYFLDDKNDKIKICSKSRSGMLLTFIVYLSVTSQVYQ